MSNDFKTSWKTFKLRKICNFQITRIMYSMYEGKKLQIMKRYIFAVKNNQCYMQHPKDNWKWSPTKGLWQIRIMPILGLTGLSFQKPVQEFLAKEPFSETPALITILTSVLGISFSQSSIKKCQTPTYFHKIF